MDRAETCCNLHYNTCNCRDSESRNCPSLTANPAPRRREGRLCQSRLLFGEEILCICSSCSRAA